MYKQSHTLGETFGKAELSVDVYHPLADDVSGDLSHLFSQLIYDGEHFFSDIMSPILPMPITIFSLSTYCWMCKQFQTFGKMFGKAELFVDVHHPLADDVSGDDNSSGLSHLFSQLVSDGERLFSDMSPILPMPITIFSLSIYCRVCRLSHALGKMLSKAKLSVDVHHHLTGDVSGDVNSPGISHLLSELISDSEHLYLLFMPITIFFLSVFCRRRGLSHTLGKTFSKAKLSVDVHHPLADDVLGHTHLTYFHSLSLMVKIYFLTCVTYFVYAHYYLLSVYLL